MSSGERADVKVGFKCNNQCVFCAQGHKREGCPMVPKDELLARIEAGRKQGSELVLTGGEPTMRPDLPELISYARSIGYDRVQIQTNGRMLSYPAVVDALLRAGATEFSPALHGHTAEIHDALTRAPGSFLQSSQGIRNVALRGASIITNSVVTRLNLPFLPDLIALLIRLGVRQAQLAFVHPVGTAMELFDEVVPRLSDLVEPLRRSRDLARQSGLRLVTEAVPYCFLPAMYELAVEASIPQTTVIDLDGQPFNYSEWRPVEGKSHGPPCESCSKSKECEGPWREYVDHFGWSEFLPIA